jgi:glycosyltransferase involved in cell wall biosynthesis
MKIAIVNQYCDIILPPFQNSVGACTYGIASRLATEAEVQVFGLTHDGGPTQDFMDQGVRYRLLEASAPDLLLMRKFNRLAMLYRPFNGGMTIPRSAAAWVHPGYGRKVSRELERGAFDIVFFQHNSQYIPVVRRGNPRAKLVLNVHHELYPQCNHRILARRFRHLDRVTAVSDFVAKQVAGSFPEIKPAPLTISNGIETSEFEATPPVSATEAVSHRIMYAGAVSPEKGVHVLIKAFRIVSSHLPTARLDIFGSLSSRPLNEMFPQQGDPLLSELTPLYQGDYIAHLKSLLPEQLVGRVAFRGNVAREELVRGYYEADVFAFPSLWNEGFGLPPIEAMAAGTPVIATRTGALTETMEDGRTGILVNRNDPIALAEALLDLMQDSGKAAAMGQAARNKILAERTWDTTATRLLELFSALLAGHASSQSEPAPNPVCRPTDRKRLGRLSGTTGGGGRDGFDLNQTHKIKT